MSDASNAHREICRMAEERGRLQNRIAELEAENTRLQSKYNNLKKAFDNIWDKQLEKEQG